MMKDKVRAMGLRNRMRPDEDALKAVPGELARLLSDRRREMARIRGDSTISEEFRGRSLREAEERHQERLDGIRRNADSSYESLMGTISEATSAVEESDTGRALLSEMRLQRNWSRYKALLDGGVAPEALVKRAGDDGESAVRALVEELPAYLEANSYQPAAVSAIEAALAREEEPYLDPEQRLGRRAREEVSAGWGRVEVAFAHVGGELDGSSTDARGSLPGWDGNEIPVEAGA